MQLGPSILLLVLLCGVHRSMERSDESSSTYVAAVVGYSPEEGINMDNKEKHFRRNVDAYVKLTQNAAKFGADIVVFPECGLVSIGLPRNPDGSPALAVEVPGPGMNINPCLDIDGNHAQELRDLSCAARENAVYTVVNLPEKECCLSHRTQCTGCPGYNPCEEFKSIPGSSRPCPATNAYFYNTNVVFDRQGAVVARYRKWHLFGEAGFHTTPKLEYSTFFTDFGVRFGVFTCFDIMFEEPSVKLVRELGVTDIVFPTAWFSELPFLTAVQTQAAWSFEMDVNLLGAGYNLPERGSAGSGIYAGRKGTVVASMLQGRNSTILIATLQKYDAERINQIKIKQIGNELSETTDKEKPPFIVMCITESGKEVTEELPDELPAGQKDEEPSLVHEYNEEIESQETSGGEKTFGDMSTCTKTKTEDTENDPEEDEVTNDSLNKLLNRKESYESYEAAEYDEELESQLLNKLEEVPSVIGSKYEKISDEIKGEEDKDEATGESSSDLFPRQEDDQSSVVNEYYNEVETQEIKETGEDSKKPAGGEQRTRMDYCMINTLTKKKTIETENASEEDEVADKSSSELFPTQEDEVVNEPYSEIETQEIKETEEYSKEPACEEQRSYMDNCMIDTPTKKETIETETGPKEDEGAVESSSELLPTQEDEQSSIVNEYYNEIETQEIKETGEDSKDSAFEEQRSYMDNCMIDTPTKKETIETETGPKEDEVTGESSSELLSTQEDEQSSVVNEPYSEIETQEIKETGEDSKESAGEEQRSYMDTCMFDTPTKKETIETETGPKEDEVTGECPNEIPFREHEQSYLVHEYNIMPHDDDMSLNTDLNSVDKAVDEELYEEYQNPTDPLSMIDTEPPKGDDGWGCDKSKKSDLYLKSENLENYVTFLLSSEEYLENSTVTLCHGYFCCNFTLVMHKNLDLDETKKDCEKRDTEDKSEDFRENENDIDGETQQTSSEEKVDAPIYEDKEISSDNSNKNNQDSELNTFVPQYQEPEPNECWNGESEQMVVCPNNTIEPEVDPQKYVEKVSTTDTNTDNSRYYYRLAAFDGTRSFDDVAYGGLQVCAVITCSDKTKESCQKHINDDNIQLNATLFTQLKITGSFRRDRAIHMPNTLVTDYLPLPISSYSFHKEVISDELVQITMTSLEDNLSFYIFGIYGRDFTSDDSMIETVPCRE